jgi:hypothetical protein
MSFPFDFLILDEHGQARLAVETSARRETNERWAVELRQSILERSTPLQTSMLIATPRSIYFFPAAAGSQTQPMRLDGKATFAAYLERAGLTADAILDRDVLLDVVHWWLQDLVGGVERGPARPELDGLIRAVRGGRVVTEAAA